MGVLQAHVLTLSFCCGLAFRYRRFGPGGFGPEPPGLVTRKGSDGHAIQQIAGHGLHQCELLDLLPLLNQVPRVHVETVGAVVYLRDTQIDQFDQFRWEAALKDICVNAAKSFRTRLARPDCNRCACSFL